MWRNWLLGILGVWLVILGFLGLPSFWQRVGIIVTGVFIAVFCFWKAIEEKIEEKIEKEPLENNSSLQEEVKESK